VRPAAAAFAVLALATILALNPGPIATGGSAHAAAADCTWQRHSKRLVKHVRRDGKVRRVVHKRHWWSCEATVAPEIGSPPVATPPPAPTPSPSPPPTPEPEPEPVAKRVSVKALEYSFTLSRPSISAGAVTVELNNQGEDPHNLQLEREGGGEAALEIAETGPDANRTASFSLAAGKYRLWCSLESHDEWGMNATLVVD
jgi:plastocyanin